MERLEEINKRLIEYFSVAWNGIPIWRIVWSEDQFEKRLMHYTDSGIILLTPEYREVPKYRQYIHNKFILERLVIVPEINKNELTEKISYEPIFVFEDKNGNALPYNWEAAKFVIDTIYATMGESSMHAKYVDPDFDQPQEKKTERINKLQEELFGNETKTTDALAHGYGVGYTGPSKIH